MRVCDGGDGVVRRALAGVEFVDADRNAHVDANPHRDANPDGGVAPQAGPQGTAEASRRPADGGIPVQAACSPHCGAHSERRRRANPRYTRESIIATVDQR